MPAKEQRERTPQNSPYASLSPNPRSFIDLHCRIELQAANIKSKSTREKTGMRKCGNTYQTHKTVEGKEKAEYSILKREILRE